MEQNSDYKKSAFKDFCTEALPYITKVTELLNKYEPGGDMNICISSDGYIRFYLSGTEWRFYRSDFKSVPKIYLEHWENFEPSVSKK